MTKKVKVMDFREERCEVDSACYYCTHNIAVDGDWVFCKKKDVWVRD